MRKILILICVIALVMSCGSKPQKSPNFLFGSKLYSNFVNYYLKGEPRLAEMAFASAENQFLRMDAMCNLSRIYIGRFVLDEGGEEESGLSKARAYATLGECQSEIEAIKYLSDENYDKKLLPDPYAQIAGADKKTLVELTDDKKMANYTKTRLLRNVAIGYLVSNPTKSEELANKALVIDRFNGWSLNILRDLIIIKTSREKIGKNNEDINKRIKLIKASLNKK
ncbi:MAG: hypothetical protein C0603_01200 [Denitrovibrio sp.]|nr:MAG: hypothetical protein C0603_01200 [Denitrovibrio sp.]